MEFDKDLSARQEARLLAKQAEEAQKTLGQMSQQQLDAIVTAVAAAFEAKAEELAEMAVRETGFGNVGDKTVKNRFASRHVLESIRDMKTVGVLKEIPEEKLWEIGVPVGSLRPLCPAPIPLLQFVIRP